MVFVMKRGRNRVERMGTGSAAVVVKHFGSSSASARRLKHSIRRLFGAVIPIEYRSARERMAHERACLELWRRRGFAVPHLVPVPDAAALGPMCHGLSYVRGERLDAHFARADLSAAEKLGAAATVLADMSRRHVQAIREGEHRLIHYDANLGNILLSDDGPVHIDFEMGRPAEPIERSAARELRKFCLEGLNALGRENAAAFIAVLRSSYGVGCILKRLSDEELNRPFFRYHLHRDRKRKARQAGLITKIDLALSLAGGGERNLPVETVCRSPV